MQSNFNIFLKNYLSFFMCSSSHWSSAGTTSSSLMAVYGWYINNFLILILWVVDFDEIWHEFHCSVWHLLLNVTHDLDFETKYTLSHQNMSDSSIKEFFLWLTG